jgi:glycosyltransferase involved in cell wall biosynthesis
MSDSAAYEGLRAANMAHRQGHLDQAGLLYAEALHRLPALRDAVEFNLKLMAARGWRGPGLDRFEQTVLQPGVFWQRLALLTDAVNFQAKHRNAVDHSETAINEILGKPQGNREASRTHRMSVVMPTYNRAEIISDSIESVLNQDYKHFELIIVDDGSTDATRSVVESFNDDRIRYVYQDNSGAGAARNVGLAVSSGDIIAYLDTDNLWNPRYLSLVDKTFALNPGRSAIYMDFIDYDVRADDTIKLRSYRRPEFDHESLLLKPYIDLNTFAHRRELYEAFGGFDEFLRRRQDYDLVLKYTWLRDPLHVPVIAALYLRDVKLNQITTMNRQDTISPARIEQTVQSYFASGLPLSHQRKKVSVIVWDRCRNRFSKPYAVAAALSETHEVELIAFDFFDEGVFESLERSNLPFVTKYFKGSDFPSFFQSMEAAMEAVTGDLMYVVNPRLPSFGLAMLVNEKKNIPFILEIDDLGADFGSLRIGDTHAETGLQDFDVSDSKLIQPYSLAWSRLLDPLAKRAPVLMTHNSGLDDHYGNSSMYMRNLKDEEVYDPDRFDRDEVRRELGFTEDDRVILFGGVIPKHDVIYEVVELMERLGDERYRWLFIGSRVSPDQEALISRLGDRIVSLPSQDCEGMARVSLAADLVILWLNPTVPASHYQFPYEATDAFAMRTPVIANSISDLGDLGRQNYLSLVDFGDWDGMVAAIRDVFADPRATGIMTEAARRLYLRQFSYAAARANVEIAKIRLKDQGDAAYPISVEFGEAYRRMRNELKQTS